MHKILYFFLMAALSLPGYSQGDKELEPLSPGGGRVIIRGAAPTDGHSQNSDPAPTVSEPEDLKDMEELQKMRAEKAKKPVSAIEQINNLGYEEISAKALLDDKVLDIIQKNLKENGMSSLPPENVRTMVLEKMKGSKLESLFKDKPKVLDFVVEFLRDKDALPGLIHILQRKDALKTYGFLCLAFLIFSLYAKNRILSSKWKASKRFVYGLFLNIFLLATNVFIFYSTFSDELNPTLKIAQKYFF